MKKIFALLLALSLLLCAFAACSSASDSTESGGAGSSGSSESTGSDATENPVTITWMTVNYNATEAALIQENFIDPFEEEFPQYTIDMQMTPDVENVIKVQLSAGEGADIFHLTAPAHAAEYARSGRLLSLERYDEEYGWEDLMFQWAHDASVVNGELYSVPMSYEAVVLYYRTDIFEENGWEFPETYEELIDVCQKAQDAGLIPIAYGVNGFETSNDWYLSQVFNNYCGRQAVKDVLEGTAKFTDDIFVDAITRYNELWQLGYIGNKQTHVVSNEEANSLFYSGKSAMLMTGTWLLAELNEMLPGLYSFGAHPGLRENQNSVVPLACSRSLGVNAVTEERGTTEGSVEFLNCMFNNKEGIAKVAAGGGMPLPTEIDKSYFGEDMNEMAMKSLDLLESASANPETSGYAMWCFWPIDTQTYMTQNITNVFLGELTPEEYCAESQKYMDQDLEAGNVPPIP